MSNELRVGMMVRIVPTGRYGTIREIDREVLQPFAVIVLDSGSVEQYKLEHLQAVKFRSELEAENDKLRTKLAACHKVIVDALAELDHAAFDDEGVVAAMGILARALKADDEDSKA